MLSMVPELLRFTLRVSMDKQVSSSEINELNQWANFFAYKPHPMWDLFMKDNSKIIGLFTGNQMGKTAIIARSYVCRFLGIHPVAEKNLDYKVCEENHKVNMLFKAADCPMCGKRLSVYFSPIRTVRFASETLPGQSASISDGDGSMSSEVRNTQYPELKKWLPQGLIKKDITARSPVLTVKDVNGGPDILVEFVSYNQATQAMAGTQRFSIFLDEEPPPDFLEEQFPRLLAADGDMVIGLTPANRLTHMYDSVYEKAAKYYRTKSICNALNLPEYEETDSGKSISVFQGATDDNPTLSEIAIKRIFEDIDDEDTILIRRYGVFKQVSGRIFKGFEYNVHRVGAAKHFPDGIPHSWLHARMIDYHERVRWACLCIALSPTDEAFVYLEYNPDPTVTITYEIAREFSSLCGDYRYTYNLIDPLATKVQVNTGLSTVQDLNRYFADLKADGVGSGGYWRGWDTKSTRGREEITKRLKNSKRVGKPFNNKVFDNGRERILPTLWILDNCYTVLKSFKNWRSEEWGDSSALATKEQKESPQQRWSHFPMCVEAIFKEMGFRPRADGVFHKPREGTSKMYFSAGGYR